MFKLLLFLFPCYLLHAQNPNYKPSNLLPDLLTFINGTKVHTLSDWYDRRHELKQLLDYYILGTKPPFPAILTYHKINSTTSNQAQSTYFSFTVDVNESSPIIFELLCPLNKYLQSEHKFSLILSQYDHRQWLMRAVQRKIFCALRTPTADQYDSSQQFKALYSSNYTWGKIPRRAWLNSVILNFIIAHNISDSINFTQIGITGHSRNGKQSLITAAYDDRITAVVGSSPGMPIASPFRYTGRDYFGETVISDIHRDWWCSNFQQFYGKENECPADGHFITALIAPRHVMFANAINDNDGDNAFANDHNYIANHDIFYRFPYKLRNGTLTVQHRPGAHHGFIEIDSYMDFFRFAFNRTADIYSFTSNYDLFKSPLLIHNFNWFTWNETFYDFINHTIPNTNENIMDRIAWLIGSDAVNICGGYGRGASSSEENLAKNNYVMEMMGELTDKYANVTYLSFSFGGYISASIYYPTNSTDAALKPIIYLHPYSYAPGYAPDYIYYEPFYYYFAQRGYAVITLSQIGFGERQMEGAYFYNRYAVDEQSKFGHMVMNVRALIDVMECFASDVIQNPNDYPQCTIFTGDDLTDSHMPILDISELTVVGYAVGAQVAIHSAALDSRIKNIASIAGFTPLRNNTNDLANAGNYYYYHTHGLIPKLGYFQNKERLIPYDYDDLLQMISPRKVLLYAPVMDKNADYASTKQCITESQMFWINKSASANYTMLFPDTVTDFSSNEFQAIANWLN